MKKAEINRPLIYLIVGYYNRLTVADLGIDSGYFAPVYS